MNSNGRNNPAPATTLRVLRLTPEVGEMSAPLNQFSLPAADRQEITLCTFFPSGMTVPAPLTLLEGDGTLPGFFRSLHTAVAAKRYDIVHAHSPHMACLFLAARLRWRGPSPATVCTVHNSYSNLRFRNRLLLLPVFAAFQRIVCCGRPSLDSFPDGYRRLAGRRLCVITNGVNLDRVDRVVAGRRGSWHPGPLVVCVGRLIRIKNPFTVLEAFRQCGHPSARLVFVGDGESRGQLWETRDRLGLAGQVETTGLIQRDEVYPWLSGADLFVSASVGEGLPIAVLEAMACRCPVLLSDIPPHREIAGGADFIPLCPADDAAAFSRQIRRFLDMTASERAAIGEKCRRLVEDRFRLDRMLDAYESLYRELLQHRPGRWARSSCTNLASLHQFCGRGSAR